MDLRRDPAFDIASPNWDTFSRWELRPDRHAGYLGDADWDPNCAPVVSSSSDNDNGEDKDDNEDFHEHGAQGCVYVLAQPPLLLILLVSAARSPVRPIMAE
jgi:hypothetical protein